MSEIKTLIASTPEALKAFLENKLEQEYYIYCQFKSDSLTYDLNLGKVMGLIFQDEVIRSEKDTVLLTFRK